MACKVSELMVSRCLALRLRGSGLRASVFQPRGFSSKSFRCCRCCGSSLRTSGFMVEGIITISRRVQLHKLTQKLYYNYCYAKPTT